MPPDQVYNALFSCTGDSARSIQGEALLNHVGHDGSAPFPQGAHPRARFIHWRMKFLVPALQVVLEILPNPRIGRFAKDVGEVIGAPA